MRRPTKIAGLFFGWAFIALGIAGLVLPLLQGILFICIGLFLLARCSKRGRRAVEHLRGRFPQLASWLERAERQARAWSARVKRAL